MSENQGSGGIEATKPQFDEAQVQHALRQIRGEQRLAVGTIAGAVGALAGASLWAVITVVTNFQIGWMAVGVGFLVGAAVRKFGKGMDKVFGVVGAALALLGCGVGNFLAVCGMVATEQDMGLLEVLSGLNPQIAQELMVATFSPMDVLFYGIAVYEGYRLSFRQPTQQDIAARITGHAPAG